jgi:hypothetical protein
MFDPCKNLHCPSRALFGQCKKLQSLSRVLFAAITNDLGQEKGVKELSVHRVRANPCNNSIIPYRLACYMAWRLYWLRLTFYYKPLSRHLHYALNTSDLYPPYVMDLPTGKQFVHILLHPSGWLRKVLFGIRYFLYLYGIVERIHNVAYYDPCLNIKYPSGR